MPAVRRRDASEAQGFSQRDDRRVDESEGKIVVAAIELRHPSVCAARQIGDEEVALRDPFVERLASAGAEPLTE